MTKIIFSICDKGAQEMHAITRPSHEAYARKVGAVYRVVSDLSKLPYTFSCKRHYLAKPHSMFHLLEKFDQVLYLDADCYVSKRTPDIFKIHERGKVGIVRHVWGKSGNALRDRNDFNAGVYIADKASRDIFSPEIINKHYRLFQTAWADQNVLNLMLEERKLAQELPCFFNDTMFRLYYDMRKEIRMVPDECRGSYIWHAVGYFKNRLEILRHAKELDR